MIGTCGTYVTDVLYNLVFGSSVCTERYLSIHLLIRLNPRRGHQTGSGPGVPGNQVLGFIVVYFG